MRVAILALGESIKHYPGRDGDEFKKPFDQVWALNGMAYYEINGGIDRLYVMDDLVYRMPYYSGQEICDKLKTYDKPIITSRAYEEWPTAERFPIEDCVKEFGLPLGLAMYSTPDWMIAHAIMEGFTSIDLFGVDNLDKAVSEMRSSTAMWIGVAMARGIAVTTYTGCFHQYFTNTSVCMEFGMYGYAFRPRIESLIFAPDELKEEI
jgi:hypothetical protein